MNQNLNTDILCHHYLNYLYHNIQGHGVNDRQDKNVSETYGEILYESVDKLLSDIPLSDQDVFFDLGSGLGKIVIQVFLTSPVKEACGIEIIPELYAQSLMAAEKVQHELPGFYEKERKLTFLLGSFLDLPLTKATVILMGSLCFSPKLLGAVGEILDGLPHLHSVFSLRPIHTLKRLSLKKIIRIQCSWDVALCYVYQRLV